MPLKFNDKLIALDLPTYNVTVLPSSNGSATATPDSGLPGTIVTLSNTPDRGYILEGYHLTGSSLIDTDKFMIKKSNVSVQASFVPKVPTDLDFLYQAKDFDGSKIPNNAINPTFGDYLQAGTITKNGTGSECYLSNASSQNNYLYVDLTASQLTAIKALAGTTYTWFFRVANTSGYGGIMSTRNGDSNFIYMIRSNGYQLQVHNSAGRDLGSNFSLVSGNVFKVRISGGNYYAKNLTNGSEWSITDNYTKAMTNRMKTFYAGAGTGGSESILAAFYGMAGIPRDTTSEEDELMRICLLSQSV